MLGSDQDNGSIFDGLNENAVTIVFGNFLDRYVPVRQALQKTLPEDIDLSDITIEKHRSGGSGEGIPDLVIRGYSFVLVIEIKVRQDRKLTDDHQREAYVSWIKKEIRDLQKEMGFVTFLIPDDYNYRVKLNSCLKKAKRKLCRSNNSNIQVLAPITWQTFVTELNSQDRPPLNELTREFYDYLYEEFEPVIFSTEEVRLMHSHSKETASGILKLMCIVKKVKANLNCFGSQIEESESPDYGYEFSSEKKSFGLESGGNSGPRKAFLSALPFSKKTTPHRSSLRSSL